MSVFEAAAFDHHELVNFCEDPKTGLRAIIAVHDTTLGPAVGGCRMFPYASTDEALHDVLRLSRGMTYKSALAELPLGGGKSVIIGDSRVQKTPELMRAMGDFVHSLGGRYVAAEDSGTGVADLKIMGERTPFVSGILDDSQHGGDPSPSTAYGVFISIRAAVHHRLGIDSLNGISVAVQGLGNVGYYLAEFLLEAGAIVYGADVNAENLAKAQAAGVIAVEVSEILSTPVDVLAPCAMGAVLNDESIPLLRAGIIAGAANNQLSTAQQGGHLLDRGILYCPDFLINAGGIIDVHHQRAGSTDAEKLAHILRIEQTLSEVLQRADDSRRQTQIIAEEMAEEVLQRTRLSVAA